VPKTRSGKIMRRLLRDIAEGRNPGDATTLRDASVLVKLQQATAQDDRQNTGTPETGSTR
jgi:acetyl-CoA synthetase